ncbi:hypothetical protein PsorP6_003065 [Peronosclerospora sorghi]|uniref:Uncharacterized protein n=1 Tax=Peronosclerospora sorghi TaxID=230839 RepID=A0ACC0VLG2_9STRA|nr:hypothetical protein PsorP6_003065 [Peronosclerospora sorghi]
MALLLRLVRVVTLSLVVLAPCAQAFVFKLQGRKEECFHEYVRTKRTAYMKVGVLEAVDTYDVRLKAFGPFASYPEQERVDMNFFDHMVVTPRDEENQNVDYSGFNFLSEHRGGWYRFCLDNSHDPTTKTVEWYTSFDLSDEKDLGEEDRMDAQMRQAYDSCQSVAGSTGDIIKLDSPRAGLLSSSHSSPRSDESRIIYYTITEVAVLAAMYAAQSFLLQKWFSSDRGYLSKRQWA